MIKRKIHNSLRLALTVMMTVAVCLVSLAQFHHHSANGSVCLCGALHTIEIVSNDCGCHDCGHSGSDDDCRCIKHIFDQATLEHHHYDPVLHPVLTPFTIPQLAAVPCDDGCGSELQRPALIVKIRDGHCIHAGGRAPPASFHA